MLHPFCILISFHFIGFSDDSSDTSSAIDDSSDYGENIGDWLPDDDEASQGGSKTVVIAPPLDQGGS